MVLVWSAVAVGVVVGGGLRVVVFRCAVRAGEPPRQACGRCGQPVFAGTWWLPVAVVVGRCRACRAWIGPPVLSLEVLTSLVFGLVAARAGSVWALVAFCWLAAAGIALAVVDLTVRLLPDRLTVPLYGGLVAVFVCAAAVDGRWGGLWRALAGGVVLAGVYRVLALIRPDGQGGGDVLLAAGLGTALGWLGWPALVTGSLLGALLAAVFGLVATAVGRLGRSVPFALGPFLVAGALGVAVASL